MDYAEDVREFLERKVKAEKLKRVMTEVTEFRSNLGKKTGITGSACRRYPRRSRIWSLKLS
jgi:hypothetical protein